MPEKLPHFGNQLRAIRKRANFSGEKLAELSGVSVRTIRGAEKRETNKLQPDIYDAVVKVLAGKLGVAPILLDVELLGELPLKLVASRALDAGKKPPSGQWVESVDTENTVARRIPVGDDISAGQPIEGRPIEMGTVTMTIVGDLYPWDDRAFGVRVRGHSMFPDYRDGEIVVGSPALADQITDGDDVCVLFTAESKFKGNRTLKRVEFLRGGKVKLHPINPEHETIECDRSDIADMGPVARHVRDTLKNGKKKWDMRRVGMAKRLPKKDVPEQEHPDYSGPDANYEE